MYRYKYTNTHTHTPLKVFMQILPPPQEMMLNISFDLFNFSKKLFYNLLFK